jgi:hypothetical protein
MTGTVDGWGVGESTCTDGPMWFTQSHAVLRTSVDLSSVMRVLFYLLAIVTVTVLRGRKYGRSNSRSVEKSDKSSSDLTVIQEQP